MTSLEEIKTKYQADDAFSKGLNSVGHELKRYSASEKLVESIAAKYGVHQNDAVPTNIAPFKAEMHKTYRELTNLSDELSKYCHDLMYMNFGGGIRMGDFYSAMEG